MFKLRLALVRLPDQSLVDGIAYYQQGICRGCVKLQVNNDGVWEDVDVVNLEGSDVEF